MFSLGSNDLVTMTNVCPLSHVISIMPCRLLTLSHRNDAVGGVRQKVVVGCEFLRIRERALSMNDLLRVDFDRLG